jgi:glycerol-3-phosphate dehydrogenase
VIRRDLEALADTTFDVVVVGGGIFGIGLAWEAVSRGLNVALIEREDFCGKASANSFRMVHGGIRYLQHADVLRVRESCAERSSLLRTAPHLVRPLPILVPTYGHGMRGRAAMRAAMLVYDTLTLDRNRGIRDARNRIPRGRLVDRAECLGRFPQIASPDLTGGALFSDGQMYNPTRLALAFLRAATAGGAVAANYVEAEGFLRRDGAVEGVAVRDVESANRFEVRGRIVVNAAGGWTERLLSGVDGVRLEPRPTFSRDTCFVVPRRLGGDWALALQGSTKDPDALLSRGARHLFLVPWRDCTLVGVWHVVYEGNPDACAVSDREIETFLAEFNAAFPGVSLRPEDLVRWNAGLVLFGENRAGEQDLRYGHHSWIVDHGRRDGVQGLVTVIGVRYTTARGVAERAVDLVFRKLGRKAPPSRTATRPLWGGEFDDFGALLAEAHRHAGGLVPDHLLEALLRNYGTGYREVLREVDGDPSLAAPVPGTTVLRAELLHAVRQEAARTLADAVLRRTDLATGRYPGDQALSESARILGGLLGWSADRRELEIAAVKGTFLARSERPCEP